MSIQSSSNTPFYSSSDFHGRSIDCYLAYVFSVDQLEKGWHNLFYAICFTFSLKYRFKRWNKRCLRNCVCLKGSFLTCLCSDSSHWTQPLWKRWDACWFLFCLNFPLFIYSFNESKRYCDQYQRWWHFKHVKDDLLKPYLKLNDLSTAHTLSTCFVHCCWTPNV